MTINQVSRQRNSGVSNVLPNEVSSQYLGVPSPLNVLFERIHPSNRLTNIPGPRFSPNRNFSTVPLSITRARIRSLLKSPATRPSLLPTSGTELSQPQVVVIILGPTYRSTTALHHRTTVRNVNAVPSKDISHLRHSQRIASPTFPCVTRYLKDLPRKATDLTFVQLPVVNV